MESKPVRIEELLAHAGWVRSLAARLVRDAGTADDVAQEVWAHALRSPPRERTNLRAWLSAAVRNTARSLQRSQSRRSVREAEAATRGHAPAAAELVERAHLHRDLVEHVLALDEPYRSLVLSHWFEQQSVAEIARRLGLTERVAQSRLHEALEILRRRMDKTSGGRAVWSLAYLKWTEPQLAAGATAAAGSALTVGGIIVASKLVVGSVAVVLAAGLGWLLWPRSEPLPPVASSPGTPESRAASTDGSAPELVQGASGSARESVDTTEPTLPTTVSAKPERWIVRGHVRGAPSGREGETKLDARFIGQWNIQDHASGMAARDGSYELDLTAARDAWLRASQPVEPAELVVVAEHPVCLLAETRATFASAVHSTFECDLVLTSAAVVTGRVVVPSDWKPIQASVNDPLRPCVGLFQVESETPRVEDGLDHASCDAAGHWTLRANRSGRFIVVACAQGLRPRSIAVDLALGQSTDVGAVDLESGASISGRVLRAGQSIGAGASVSAKLKSNRRERVMIRVPDVGRFVLNPVGDGFEHERVVTRTQADGSFQFGGLAPVEYELCVDTIPEFRMAMGGRDRVELTVRAPQAGVVLEGIPPTIELAVTVNGRPPKDADLEGVFVDLVPGTRDLSGGRIDLTRASKGYGKIQLVAGVAYELRVKAGRYAPTVLPLGALAFGEQRTFALDLKPQDQMSTLVLHFIAEPPENLAVVQVAFLDASEPNDERAEWQQVKRSDQGTFVLPDRQPGSYRVLVRPFDHWTSARTTYYLGCRFSIALAPKATVQHEVKLETGGLVRLSAKDERGGFVRASVELRNTAGETIPTDFYCLTANGHYACGWYLCEQGPNDHPPLPAGHYEFTLKAEGFATEVVPVDIVAGETKTLEVILNPR